MGNRKFKDDSQRSFYIYKFKINCEKFNSVLFFRKHYLKSQRMIENRFTIMLLLHTYSTAHSRWLIIFRSYSKLILKKDCSFYIISQLPKRLWSNYLLNQIDIFIQIIVLSLGGDRKIVRNLVFWLIKKQD